MIIFVGPIAGFICQFMFMPGFSFLVGYLYTDDMLFRYNFDKSK